MAEPKELPTPAMDPPEPPIPLPYRPPFARSYPHHPELDRLLAAFLDGNYALVFKEAPPLAKQAKDQAVPGRRQRRHEALRHRPQLVAEGGIGETRSPFAPGQRHDGPPEGIVLEPEARHGEVEAE
ncbi:MAG: hypothetical protein RMJ98_09735, partial [Myxococcales bacterium]|nr:hypothetical protein [Myxococcales bacterium]